MYHIAIKYKHVARLKTDHAYTMLAHHSHARAMLERKQHTGRLALTPTQLLGVVVVMQRLLPAARGAVDGYGVAQLTAAQLAALLQREAQLLRDGSARWQRGTPASESSPTTSAQHSTISTRFGRGRRLAVEVPINSCS